MSYHLANELSGSGGDSFQCCGNVTDQATCGLNIHFVMQVRSVSSTSKAPRRLMKDPR